MKRIEKTLLYGSFYTVFLLLVFYLYAFLASFDSIVMSIGNFLLILLFGFTVSLVRELMPLLPLKRAGLRVVEYFVLLTVFCAVFFSSGSFVYEKFTDIIVAAIVFTLLYAVLLAGNLLISLSARIPEKAPSKEKQKEEKKSYTPLYK